MKTLTFFLVVFTAMTVQGRAQAFSNVSLIPVAIGINDRETINFTIPRETNIRLYRIEASNDSTTFEVIATVPSKGNALFPRSYSYDVNAYSYKYYRVGMVEMNGIMPYSDVVTQKKAINAQPEIKTRTMIISSNVLANQ